MRTASPPDTHARWKVAVLRARRLLNFVRPQNRLLAFAGLIFAWQAALFLALFNGAIDPVSYVEVHAIGCAGLASWAFLRAAGGKGSSAALQVVACSALAGPFGAFAAIALTFPGADLATDAAPDSSRRGAPPSKRPKNERAERLHAALLDRRVRLEGASRIRPLADVLAEGSRAERLEALRIAYRRYDADLSSLLKRALNDPDASVRVLAATVIARLHAAYTRNIGDRQAESNVDEGVARSWAALAEARLDYARSGLLEPTRAREQAQAAAGDLRRAAELDADGGTSPEGTRGRPAAGRET